MNKQAKKEIRTMFMNSQEFSSFVRRDYIPRLRRHIRKALHWRSRKLTESEKRTAVVLFQLFRVRENRQDFPLWHMDFSIKGKQMILNFGLLGDKQEQAIF